MSVRFEQGGQAPPSGLGGPETPSDQNFFVSRHVALDKLDKCFFVHAFGKCFVGTAPQISGVFF